MADTVLTGKQQNAELPRWSLCFAVLLVLKMLGAGPPYVQYNTG